MLASTHEPEPTLKPRKQWQKPMVRHISAGTAEAGAKIITDGAFAYS